MGERVIDHLCVRPQAHEEAAKEAAKATAAAGTSAADELLVPMTFKSGRWTAGKLESTAVAARIVDAQGK